MDFFNQRVAMRRQASGTGGDGPEAQNSRKGDRIDRNPGFFCSPLFVGCRIRSLEKIHLPFRTVERVPVCLFAEPASPNRSHSWNIVLYSFCSVR